jgi:hypothetical protein
LDPWRDARMPVSSQPRLQVYTGRINPSICLHFARGVSSIPCVILDRVGTIHIGPESRPGSSRLSTTTTTFGFSDDAPRILALYRSRCLVVHIVPVPGNKATRPVTAS